MPELPEVETVKRTLELIYLNKKIKDVIVNHENILANINSKSFKDNLVNQEILSFSQPVLLD